MELATILVGVNPATGEPLIAGNGSAGRAARQRSEPLALMDPNREWYSAEEAAALIGVSPSYLRRLLKQEVLASDDGAPGVTLDTGGWQVRRTPPKVVAGYELTFSRQVRQCAVGWR